jgi:hypothetical protein
MMAVVLCVAAQYISEAITVVSAEYINTHIRIALVHSTAVTMYWRILHLHKLNNSFATSAEIAVKT